MTSLLWSSIPWVESGGGWHKHRAPYTANATYLHTFDVWVPKTANRHSLPAPDFVPGGQGPWVVYIHGGAWRDPLVDSSSFESAALKLLSDKESHISGIASVNYPLSSHPKHPTHPAPPRHPLKPVDIARTAKHPDHVVAVLSAITYLQNELGVAHDYVLSGHSCGATLTFQTVMNPDRWGAAAGSMPVPKVKKPKVIAPINGLYDLHTFINNPTESHEKLQPLYVEFTKNAFGDDETLWRDICPTMVSDWSEEWPEGKIVIIAQSKNDSLVPYSQTELMKEHLRNNSKLEVIEMPASGDHNDIWKQADEIVEIMKRAVMYCVEV
ncbi:putative kynurenine formamidase [Fusarium sporotrichioides]|uniref:Kynurenine formamidase n=1 Tax=Fusarium sporotrichioides TaxID=5514 RepID=A0A395RMX2_FUSSP|nr:putative kynurenine formamidase [Fusarium sporotrichioides]